jgi:hypothetical protein
MAAVNIDIDLKIWVSPKLCITDEFAKDAL